ncbi:MAG: S1 family peptidase [Candidatus Entotheonellia bacterium]
MARRRTYKLSWLWAVVVWGFLLGCAPHRVDLPPVPPWRIAEAETLPIPIALHIAKDLRGHTEKTRLSTPYGGPLPYEFNVGEVMAAALEEQMRHIFKKVDITDVASSLQSPPQAGLAGAMRIGFKKSPKESSKESPKKSPFIDIRFEPDIIGTVAKANYEFEWEASFQDTEGTEHFRRSEVKGIKFSSEIATMGDKSAFVPGIDGAIRNGLQQLSDAIIHDAPLRDFTEMTLVNEMKPGVVVIRAGSETGAGFIVHLSEDAAYVVTAAHVLGSDEPPKVEFFTQQDPPFSARVIGQGGKDLDLAILLVRGNLPSRLEPLQLAPTMRLDEGAKVRVVGHPLFQGGAPWSVIEGIITYLEERDQDEKGQIIMAPLRVAPFGVQGTLAGGNSGGPVIRAGKVVGLVTREVLEVRPDVRFENIVPTATILKFLEQWGVPIFKAGT